MAIPTITPNTQDFPSLGQAEAVFESNTNHLLSVYMPQFETELNASINGIDDVIDDINVAESKVAINATIASNSASQALAVSNNKGDWISLSGNLSIPASVNHNGRVWVLNNNLIDVSLSEPSISNTDWTEITSSGILTPSILGPLDGETVANLNMTIIGSPFIQIRNTFVGTHTNSIVEFSQDVTFASVESTSIVGMEELESIGLSANTLYYARLRHVSGEFSSEWSEPISFTTPSTGISVPAVTISGGNIGTDRNVQIELSSYLAINHSQTHATTTIQVASDAGFTTIVTETVDDVVNLTSWTSGDLEVSTTYYIRAKYKSASYDSGFGNSVIITTSSFQTKTFIASEDLEKNDLLGIKTDGTVAKLTTLDNYTSIATSVGDGVSQDLSCSNSVHLFDNVYFVCSREDGIGMYGMFITSDASGFTIDGKLLIDANTSRENVNDFTPILKVRDDVVIVGNMDTNNDPSFTSLKLDLINKTFEVKTKILESGWAYANHFSKIDDNTIYVAPQNGNDGDTYTVETDGSLSLNGIVLNMNVDINNKICYKMSDTKVAMYGEDGSGYLRYCIADFNSANGVITEGTWSTPGYNTNRISESLYTCADLITDINANRKLVICCLSSVYYLRVDTYDGTTVAIGDTYATTDRYIMGVKPLSNGNYIVFMQNSNYEVTYREFSISGTVITFLNSSTLLIDVYGSAVMGNVSKKGDEDIFIVSYHDVQINTDIQIKEFYYSNGLMSDNISTLTSSNPFLGYADEDTLNGNKVSVKLNNVFIGGFEGLVIGAMYYYNKSLQEIDTVISDIQVGIAISATEILVKEY